MKQLTPKNDIIFKKIFGSKGNEDILKDLLSGILEEKIKEVEIQKDLQLEKSELSDKTGILDIKALTNNNVQINIEMQIVNYRNMEKRTLFYWSKLYTQGISAGESFYKLKKTITINLLDFNYFDTKQYHTKWHIVEDVEKDKMLTDVLEIHFIELQKFIKRGKEPENKKEEWLYFIDNTKGEKVKMAVEKNKVIEKAKEELDYLVGDEATKRIAELRDKGLRDYNGAMEYAKEEGLRQGKEEGLKQGREQGREEGREENKIDVAKNMLRKGLEIELICEVTNLSVEQIKQIDE